MAPALRRVVLLALTSVAALVPATAHAALTWSSTPPGSAQTVSPSGNLATNDDVATDAQGNAIAVWIQLDSDPASMHKRVFAAFRGPGQNFGAPKAISQPDIDALNPHVAMNARGDAVVTWEHDVTGPCCPAPTFRWISYAMRPAGGTFAPPRDGVQGGVQHSQSRPAIDNQGNVTLSFVTSGSVYPQPVIHVDTRPAGANTDFTGTQTLSNSSEATTDPRIAMDGAGNAVVSWTSYTSPGNTNQEPHIQAAYRAAGVQNFGAAQQLSVPGTLPNPNPPIPYPDGDAQRSFPALAPNGDAMVAWDRFDGNGNFYRTQAAVRAKATGTFGQPIDVSPTGFQALSPRVAYDPSGRAYVAWMEGATGGARIQVASQPAGGTFGPAVQVSTTGTNPTTRGSGSTARAGRPHSGPWISPVATSSSRPPRPKRGVARSRPPRTSPTRESSPIPSTGSPSSA